MEEVWQRALALKDPELDLPEAFYVDELEQVILDKGIETESDYLRVSRTGRGTPLSRVHRARIWPVFEDYRLNLSLQGGKEIDDAYRAAAALLADDRGGLPYTTVIVDEAQDMGTQAYRLIRTLVPEESDDLFIVGDGHQRIYGRSRVVSAAAGSASSDAPTSSGSITGRRRRSGRGPCVFLTGARSTIWTAVGTINGASRR